MSDDFRKNNPSVAAFIDRLQAYYNGDKNNVFTFSDEFKNALKEMSTLSDEQIQDILNPNSGPSLDSWDLDLQASPDGELSGYPTKGANGETPISDDLDESGNPIMVPSWTPRASKNNYGGEIVLDDNITKAFEKGLKGELDKDGFKKSTDAFISTLFHEMCHFGRFKNKTSREGATKNSRGSWELIEYGERFERKAYGTNVTRYDPPIHQTPNPYKPQSN